MVGPLLRRHLAPSDPHWLSRLAGRPGSEAQALRGYLTGSIDAVSGSEPDGRPPRYLVVDYKTNWLGGFDGEVLKIGDYTPARMAAR